jgi:hypothetical protein
MNDCRGKLLLPSSTRLGEVNRTVSASTPTLQPCNRYATASTPKPFVITLRQIAKHLKIQQERILNWEKWHNVLWIHIQGLGGYFVSYRKLEQWIAACRSSNSLLSKLKYPQRPLAVHLQEAQRYTEDALSRLEAIWQQRYTDISNHQQT